MTAPTVASVASKIRVTTTRHGNDASAVRQRSVTDDELRSEFTRVETLGKLAATGRELGHDPNPGDPGDGWRVAEQFWGGAKSSASPGRR